jgi:hypothetical protein
MIMCKELFEKTLLKPPILVVMIELLTLQAIEAEWGVYQSGEYIRADSSHTFLVLSERVF